jgi:very-short-patch-repair endonuclease
VSDCQRKEFLKEEGIRLIRFNNLDVLKNIEGVLKAFKKNSPFPLFIKKRGDLLEILKS